MVGTVYIHCKLCYFHRCFQDHGKKGRYCAKCLQHVVTLKKVVHDYGTLWLILC